MTDLHIHFEAYGLNNTLTLHVWHKLPDFVKTQRNFLKLDRPEDPFQDFCFSFYTGSQPPNA